MRYSHRAHGFTLIEMVIVLAIISVLAAVLTPVLSSYLDRARFIAAQSDVKNIAAALIEFNTDTRLWPIYRTGADIPNGFIYNVLKGPGNDADVAPDILDWPAMLVGVNGTTSLDGMINHNLYLLSTVGISGWHGAYIELGPDPWGTSYYVTVANLRPGSIYAAYVISPGPNQVIETLYIQSKAGRLAVGGDDVVQRIK